MKIRNKITIVYTAITALLLLCLNFYIFYSASLYIKNNFYAELSQRALLTAQVYLEQDEMDANLWKQVKNKFLQTPPNVEIRMYDKNNSPAFVDSTSKPLYSDEIINRVRNEQHLEFEDKGRQIVGIFYPDNQGDFVILVSSFDENGIEKINYLKNVLIIGLILSLFIVILSGRFISRQALDPMSSIIKKVNRISASNLHLRLDEGKGKDEIAELAVTFNKMLARLETVFETQKTFVHNASHELRTPLTSLMVQIDVVLQKERSNEEYKETLKSNLIEVEKLNQLTTSLLNLAKTSFDDSNLSLCPIYMDEFLLEVRKEVENQSNGRVIKVEYNIPPDSNDLIIQGNKQLLRIALFNILENACKFSANKEVRIVLECSNRNIKIKVSDQGIGIPFDETGKIFEPFYRATNAYNQSGSGIGLSLTKKIIELHKGEIRVYENPEGGTVFEVVFAATA